MLVRIFRVNTRCAKLAGTAALAAFLATAASPSQAARHHHHLETASSQSSQPTTHHRHHHQAADDGTASVIVSGYHRHHRHSESTDQQASVTTTTKGRRHHHHMMSDEADATVTVTHHKHHHHAEDVATEPSTPVHHHHHHHSADETAAVTSSTRRHHHHADAVADAQTSVTPKHHRHHHTASADFVAANPVEHHHTRHHHKAPDNVVAARLSRPSREATVNRSSWAYRFLHSRAWTDHVARYDARMMHLERHHDLRIAEIEAHEANAHEADAALHSGNVVRAAEAFRGTPYVMGGTSRSGFDCSGFTRYIFGQSAGVELPRTAEEQYYAGQAVSKGELQAGDLVFFRDTYRRGISHVGMYIGDGRFVHACNPSKGVTISSLDEAYYINHYAGARRVMKSREDSGE